MVSDLKGPLVSAVWALGVLVPGCGRTGLGCEKKGAGAGRPCRAPRPGCSFWPLSCPGHLSCQHLSRDQEHLHLTLRGPAEQGTGKC